MQQQTGQYAGSSLYPSGARSDASYPYTNIASYGSAPPYLSSPSYCAENASYQTPPYPPQGPPYIPPEPSLTDSMSALNISSQGAYPAPPSSYASTVPSYDQSYAATTATQIGPGPLHHPSTSSQPSNYVPAGHPLSGGPPGPGAPSQVDYDLSSSSLIGSYGTNQQAGYEPSSFVVGSHGTNQQSLAMSSLKADYDSSSSVMGSYGANQHGMQGYDYSNNGLSQGRIGIYDQGDGMYSAGQDRDFEGSIYSQSLSYDPTYYDKPTGHDRGHAKGGYGFGDVGLGEVYAYDGGRTEPYGARGTGSGSSWGALDSSNSCLNGGFSSFKDSGSSKLPKAVPKVDMEDKSSGVQKYRVKLLSDSSSGSGPLDVLCQIGLDGVRMISPSTNKTVRIYPLETITRWEVNEPSIFTFWAKSAVDMEPRRIRLQSGSYTTNAILDTLTAACVQFSEMVGKEGPIDSSKASIDSEKGPEQVSEKKKTTLVDWVTLRNRQNAPEEKQHWVPDEAVTKCSACSSDFGAFLRRHHCRNCGDVFCDKCTNGRVALTADEDALIVRVCDRCLAEVTQRLSNAKELRSKPPPAPRSHEDLAKKLQEELERNSSRRSTTSSSNSSVKERSGQTTVLNCSACGSISLVNGSNERCPTCGVDSSASHSGRESSSSLKGPPHLWSSSDGSGKHMREVACPTCTVHLQVQVPSSGTETVECGVCQHPFLVSAH